MTGSLNLRHVTSEDINILSEIGRQTFYESFFEITPPQDMIQYLELSFNPLTLAEELKDEKSIFYFVENRNTTLGYGKINIGKTPYVNEGMGKGLEIQRLYILKKYQRMGAGRLLMQDFIRVTQQEKLPYIWLSTGAFNNNALNFYLKFGFEKKGTHRFMVGNTAYEDLILIRKFF